MASRIAGYTDTQNLDGILFTSKFNKIPKSPAALRHTSNMSLIAITNLDKIMQFEVLYAEVRKAHDALLLFMSNTPGRYTYRPALCPALRGHQKCPWLPPWSSAHSGHAVVAQRPKASSCSVSYWGGVSCHVQRSIQMSAAWFTRQFSRPAAPSSSLLLLESCSAQLHFRNMQAIHLEG